jgi:hypothetical protein
VNDSGTHRGRKETNVHMAWRPLDLKRPLAVLARLAGHAFRKDAGIFVNAFTILQRG